MQTKTKGLLLAFSAYLLWAFLSLYWKALSAVSSYNALSYRILWTVITMGAYAIFFGQKERFKRELTGLWQDKKSLWTMILAGYLIATNWFFYIWGVGHGQATEASLGYYLMPIFSVLLSLVFLKERLSKGAILSVILATLGVFVLMVQTGSLPAISLILASSFSLYGLFKKNISLSSDVAMLVEATVVLPMALVYLLFFQPGDPYGL